MSPSGPHTRPKITSPPNKRMPPASHKAPDGRSLWSSIGKWLHGAVFENGALKLVALALSITLFVVVNTSRDAVIGVTVGVSYTMPADRVMVEPPVDQVRVAIKGSWRRIKRFDEREIGRIYVDLRDVTASEYRFSEEQVRLPSGLHLLSIQPPSIPLSFEPLIEKTVRVSVATIGNPRKGYKLSRVEPRPSQITVRGAQNEIENLDTVETRKLDITGRQNDFSLSLPLIPPKPAPVIQLLDTRSVEVAVTIGQELSTRRISSLPIEIRNPRGLSPPQPELLFSVEPKTVDVMLTGPQLAIESFQGTLEAYIEVLAEDVEPKQEPAAARTASIRITGAPTGVGIEVVPSTTQLQLVAPE